jgi:outer membrane protein assembly factor BamB
MVSSERGLPVSFDPKTGKNIKWSAELGTEAHSTPVIAGGRVYVGTNNGHPREPREQGDRGVLMCFEEKTGKFLWQLLVPKRDEDIYFDWPKSGISSPVTVEGERVYLVSNRGEVLCLEARDGHVLWNFNLTTGAGIWSHDAAHSSILIQGNQLYLNSGTGVDNTHKRIRTPDAPSLVVLDKRTGKLLARDDEHIAPNIFHSTWSAPSLGKVNGRTLLFFAAGNGIIYAFEPLNPHFPRDVNQAERTNGLLSPALSSRGGEGEERASNRVDSAIHQPTSPPIQDSTTPLLHVSSLRKVWQFDFDPGAPKTNVHKYNSNRRESPSNFYGMPVFYEGRIYATGGGDIWWGKTEAWLKCIDPSGTGDITTTGLVWSYPLQKHVMGTSAIANGLVFIADCGRTFHCVDARTGQVCWTAEIDGEAWASPLVAGGKVYLGTRSGSFYVFSAARERKLLHQIELGDPISSTAAAANGVLYVTTMTHLYAVHQPRD